MREKIRAYYKLTKPGVLYGNVLTALAGFLLASHGQVDWLLFLALTSGMTLVIASACVINNYLDQDIDSKMERTKVRPLIRGDVSGKGAVIYSIVLGVVGMAILVAFTNWLVVAVGLLGFIDYVVLYGMLSKRLSIHGTLVGSISGAAPILAGYCAVSGALDVGALLVFLVLFLWQMPEFYSIAIYRQKEYAAAGVPVMSVVKGKQNTIIQIFIGIRRDWLQLSCCHGAFRRLLDMARVQRTQGERPRRMVTSDVSFLARYPSRVLWNYID